MCWCVGVLNELTDWFFKNLCVISSFKFFESEEKIGTNERERERESTPSTKLSTHTLLVLLGRIHTFHTKLGAILFPGLPSRIRTKEKLEIKSCIFTRAKFRGQILLAYSLFRVLQDSQSIPIRFPPRSELF